MLVTAICEEKLYTISLPERIRGQYWIENTEYEITNPRRKMIGIEAEEKRWIIRATKKLHLFNIDGTQISDKLILEVGNLYIVELNGKSKIYLFIEPYTKDRCTFNKFSIQSNTVINIGKAETNQIIIDNSFVSGIHAQLTYTNGKWTLYDCNSKNGVYVNEQRLVGTEELSPGDMIQIMGVKFVVGSEFIAMNNPDNSVKVNSKELSSYNQQEILTYERPDDKEEIYYYRSPHFRKNYTPLELKVDAPTASQNSNETSIFLSLGPSLIMGITAFVSGVFTVMNIVKNGDKIVSALPSIFMTIGMLAGMIIFPIFMKTRERKSKIEKEQQRQKKYLKYLDIIRAEINQASDEQKDVLNENYPNIMMSIKQKGFYEHLLWNRIIGQQDFLYLRLGVGNTPLDAKLKFPDQRFSIDDDIMRNEVNKLSKEKFVLEQVPVGFSLDENRVVGIVGNNQAVAKILNNIFVQIAALHSYDEVKIVFLCDERDFNKFGYVRWMQHIWDNDFKFRFLAMNLENIRELNSFFMKKIEERKTDTRKIPYPHYVIISTSKGLSDHCNFISEVLKDDSIEGFSYLAVYDELKNLPKECSCIVQVEDSYSKMYSRSTEHTEEIMLTQDMVELQEAEKAIMKIAEYRLDLNIGQYVLPDMLTFLELFNVSKFEHLNLASRWKENNPTISLQTPIGLNSEGNVFYLDLHEKAHGPHGLIAGMTGSGKSEFIITFVLSLAVNYSPEEVAFILIDYKGGGLTGAFDNEKYHLPHLAGTITNLDGGSISRALLSIQSELRRRQTIFNKARRISNEGTMDIYKYQKMYRNKLVTEPVPHLFIVSDEFAELKSQQPEFMTQLISTARIGRSLGVHLVLATQKPNGVVNEQIWANSKFKVCLKVQDKSDSMDMLKRPDAAELTETGRFYLQVGYNELFEIGQSAWCGAPYIPKDEIEKEVDERIQLIDYQGNILEEVKPNNIVEIETNDRKQIVEIAQYIEQVAKEEGVFASQMWEPEIPPIILVDDLEEKYQYHIEENELNPVIGELDDPFNQEQRLLTLPITQKGNVIIYGLAGSGKEIFITAMLYSLYKYHTSQTLNTFILDFGAETLRAFEKAPQTADFVVSGEDEKLNNLFNYLRREIERRKKIFADFGGDFVSYTKSGNMGFPNIVVIINNYVNFAEQYEVLDDMVASIVRDCMKYGIYFVVTTPLINGIRHKIKQSFNQTFVLQMNDKVDYSAILGNTGGVYPSTYVGRGIFKQENTYEFQTAHIASDANSVFETIREFCMNLLKDTTQNKAMPIPVMPKVLSHKEFENLPVAFNSVPYAISYDRLEPIVMNLDAQNVIQVLAMDKYDLSPFAMGISEQLSLCHDSELFIIDPLELCVNQNSSDNVHLIADRFEETIIQLFNITVERHNAFKRKDEEMVNKAKSRSVIVIIVGLECLKKQLSEDGIDKLRLILEKTRGKFNMSFWVFDDYVSSNSYCTENWCVGNGIWIGNGLGEQIRMKYNHKATNLIKNVDFSSGYIVEKGAATYIKLFISGNTKMEEYDE